MIICGDDLQALVRRGIITNVTDDLINAGSIDITCGPSMILEKEATRRDGMKALLEAEKGLLEKCQAESVSIPVDGLILHPGQAVLLESEQIFNLPTKPIAIFAEYKLKSTMARNFVDAFNAGWCDAGWHGAKLTIELINKNSWTRIRIAPGMRIGQMIFYRGSCPVPDELSYATKGRYNNTTIVTGAR